VLVTLVGIGQQRLQPRMPLLGTLLQGEQIAPHGRSTPLRQLQQPIDREYLDLAQRHQRLAACQPLQADDQIRQRLADQSALIGQVGRR
jgi:hypothetical protein